MYFQRGSRVPPLLRPLVGRQGGILSILDDEALIPKTTDQTFASKVTKAHGSHPRMVKSKMGGDVKFGIKHFAGEARGNMGARGGKGGRDLVGNEGRKLVEEKT